MDLAMSYTLIRKDEKMLIESARNMGVGLTNLSLKDMALEIGKGDSRYDAILDRCMSHFQTIYVMEHLKAMGTVTVNDPEVIKVCGDKALTSMALMKNGVPTTRTFLAFDQERAIQLLPPGFRTVLVLHDVEGFTHREIGERLGITDGTSKSQLHGARKAMRRLLSGDLELA